MRSAIERATTAVAIAGCGMSFSDTCRAQEAVDPTRGRIGGDVCLVAGAGGVVGDGSGRADVELRARYLEAVGLFATYEDAIGAAARMDPERVIAAGLELRPLFLYRWLRGLETLGDYFDLTIDSLGLELGAFLWAPASGPTELRPGYEVAFGGEVPFVPQATGLWLGLHGGLRWEDQPLAAGSGGGSSTRSAFLAISVAWHQTLRTHLVDVSDEAPR